MPTPRFPTAAAVLRAARSQVGVTEDPAGSNHTIYGDQYGQPRTYWCGHFVWWCFNRAGIDLRRIGISDPGFTPAFFAEARRSGWVIEAGRDIDAGDVLFFDFVAPFNTSGIQHVGIATGRPRRANGVWIVPTIEGNTTSGPGGPQDNGGGVFERDRPLNVIVDAVRPPYAPGISAKPVPSGRTRVARRAAAAAAVLGAVTAVGNAAVHSPATAGTPVVAAPMAAAPRPPVAHTPTRKPAATHPARPARKPAPAAQRTIIGPLRYGSTGDAVRVLQRYIKVTATGYFGRTTLRRVLAAQAAADIPADGVVGPATARALGVPYVPAAAP